MRLTVLGRYGPSPAANGACSGYLLEAEDACILLDCGNGVLARLLNYKALEDIDAIILSHLHSDHVSDMLVLRYALDILKKRGRWLKPLTVYAPQMPDNVWRDLHFNDVFDLQPISADLEVKIGSVRISFEKMVHPVPTFATKFEDINGRIFVYSGDTSENDALIKFSSGCDMLLCDGGLLAPEKTSPNAPHLSAKEAAMTASCAGAKAFLLTHLWFEHDEELYKDEARVYYSDVQIARELHTYEI